MTDQYEPTPTCDPTGMCTGYQPSAAECSRVPADPHPCPFRSEIHDDNATMCRCCEAHTRECADEV
jgi:hypothetical protein